MNSFSITCILILTFFVITNTYSQEKTVVKVSNINNLKPVKKAVVVILNTNFRTVTNSSGIANLNDVPEGYYKFKVSWRGYVVETQDYRVETASENYFEIVIVPIKIK